MNYLFYIKEIGNFKNIPEYLLIPLFDLKYDNLLHFEEKNKEIFNDLQKYTDLNAEIMEDFENLDNLFDSFKSMKIIFNNQFSDKNNKINQKIPLFKEFFDRLNKSFNNDEIPLDILTNIHMFEKENPLIGDNHIFISECLDNILNNLSQKYNDLISEFKDKIDKLKQQRRDKRNILEFFKKLNEEIEIIYKEENVNDKKYFLNRFIDYINKDKKEEQKKDYSEAEEILDTIRTNLKLLLNEKIGWSKYEWIKPSSLLFLKQNKLI